MLGWVVLVVFSWLAWRSWRSGIEVTRSGVVLRQGFRTRSIPWDQVAGSEVVDGIWRMFVGVRVVDGRVDARSRSISGDLSGGPPLTR